MGDMAEIFRDMKTAKKKRRIEFGIPCPGCKVVRPKAQPTLMLPEQKCKVCGYVDPRKWNEVDTLYRIEL